MTNKIFITRRLPPIAREMLSEHFEVDEYPLDEVLPAEKMQYVLSHYDGILTNLSFGFSDCNH
jgi:hypothetical protein